MSQSTYNKSQNIFLLESSLSKKFKISQSNIKISHYILCFESSLPLEKHQSRVGRYTSLHLKESPSAHHWRKAFYCWEFLKHNFPAKNSVPPLIRIAGIPRWKEAHSPVRVNSFFLIFLLHSVCDTFLWCFGLLGAQILLEQGENKFPISLPHTVCPKPQTHLISSHYILILHCFLCNLCRPQDHSVCAQN